MTELAFYVTALTTGTVLGLRIGSRAEEVERVLGPDFLDDPGRGTLRRDYGLVEFGFERDHGWMCRVISIQVHRLAGQQGDTVPTRLREKYGSFAPYVPYEILAPALASYGYTTHIDRQESPYPGLRVLQVDQTGTEIVVVADKEAERAGGRPGHGDVWSISLSREGRPREFTGTPVIVT
ncbi:hypothetical protein AB0B89_15785 [Sphaerisporangium sp. NPDC049002]|uniref:hypothetical protein n=1 Tax=unclassified Sphaerisporangium TaxID=2630420 RepID=UPI0033D8A32E